MGKFKLYSAIGFSIFTILGLVVYFEGSFVEKYEVYKKERAYQEQLAWNKAAMERREINRQKSLKLKEEMKPFVDKIRVEYGQSSLKNHKKMNVRFAEDYLKDRSDVNTLHGLIHTHWMMSKAHKQLEQVSQSEEEFQKALEYLDLYEKRMLEATSSYDFRINNERHLFHIVKYYTHLRPHAYKKVDWKQKLLDHFLEKWEKGNREYKTAHWIMSLYSSKQEWNHEKGQQASMPQIQKWEKEMRRIGKPEGYSRGSPW